VPSLLLILRINTLVQLVLPLQEIDFSSYYPINHYGLYLDARVLHREAFRRTIDQMLTTEKREKLRACGVTRAREINIAGMHLARDHNVSYVNSVRHEYEKFSGPLTKRFRDSNALASTSAYFSTSDQRH
jgi:hypothetical protein